MPSSQTLFERSCAAIPGGVNSSIRAFRSVGGEPYVVARADGASIIDIEGTTYLDLVQSYGAVILGHAHPAITAAVSTAASDGTSFGAPTPREMKLAEAIAERVPSCERVRLMNSGTEATSTAIRLARGVTGRDRIVTFAGNFHGATDALLVAGGSGIATLGLPGTAGVPNAAVAETMVAPYNVVPSLTDEVAAVIVEPVAANMGVVAPEPGFLQGLRAECDRVGALLIFDEVITGFRLASGGAQAKYGVVPDITCFGKVIGGGLPIGADRRSCRCDGAPVPAGARLPRRDPVGQSVGDSCRIGRARPTHPGRVRRVVGACRSPRSADERRVRQRRLPRSFPPWWERSSASSVVLRRRTLSAISTMPGRPMSRRLQRSSERCLPRGRNGPRGLRGNFRWARARRQRDRPNRCGCGARCCGCRHHVRRQLTSVTPEVPLPEPAVSVPLDQ